MKTFSISLSTVQDVQKFINKISAINGDCDLSSAEYTVDAKSFLGILSLDMHKPLNLEIYSDRYETKDIIDIIKDFLVK